jgi:tRNA-(ms[2]io[6]A)-hydroxylase
LIEARSCERFRLLAEQCSDAELARVYKDLYASEAGHYRLFLDLARQLPEAGAVEKRWQQLLAEEARIIRRQQPGLSMHSGVFS